MVSDRWGSERQAYVLYENREQFSQDCDRFPFESIPRRVFLDTNVVNLLVKYPYQIFEQEPIPPDTQLTLALDIEALMHVFWVGMRANWHILASPKTIEEISRTRDSSLRASLLNYALEFVNRDLSDDDFRFGVRFGRRLVDMPFVAALPDMADRELIGNAIGFGCDAFCTCDRATIIRKRSRLHLGKLCILTPAEWWAHIKPWGGLWC
jgi:hypothetical protein